MRKEYTYELEKLHIDFNKLGGLVIEQLNKVLKYFQDADTDLADEIIENDQIINQMEMYLEQKSIQLIALQAPVTADLRKIITVLKASSDLERIGDRIKSIAQAIRNLPRTPEFSEVENKISIMGNKIKEMIKKVLEAFIQQDTVKATETAAMNKEINQMRNQIRKESFSIVKHYPHEAEAAAEYFYIAQNLEKIGDYAKNVAEWVLYLDSGEIIDLD